RERIEPAGAVRVWSGVDGASGGALLDDGLKHLDVIPHPVQVELGFGPGFPTRVVELSLKRGLATAQIGQLHVPGGPSLLGVARGVRHASEAPGAPDGPDTHLVAQVAGVIRIIVQFEGDPTPGHDRDAVMYDRERHCTASPITALVLEFPAVQAQRRGRTLERCPAGTSACNPRRKVLEGEP